VILDSQRRTGLSDLRAAKREDVERPLDQANREISRLQRGRSRTGALSFFSTAHGGRFCPKD
jgi:hypothetical protein